MNNIPFSAQARFEEQALEKLFGSFSDRNIRFAVLRNYESLPKSIGGTDIDILVHPDDLDATMREIASVAKSAGASFAKGYQDDMITQLVLVKRADLHTVLTIKIDLLHNRQVLGVEFLTAEEMLEHLRTHNGVPIVSEQVMLLDKWSFHLLLGAPLPHKYYAEFVAIARSNRDSLVCLLTRFLSHKRAAGLVDALAEGNGSSMILKRAERCLALFRLWFAQGIAALPRSLRFASFRLRDRLRPAGIFLSISGPDGSGKTTVIALVIAQLKQVYGEGAVSYKHFRPSLLPRIASVAKASKAIQTVDENYAEPHRANPSGPVGSFLRLFYYWLDYFGGYLRTIHPLLVRREVQLFDRYIYDMIADPGRSRIALPVWLIRTAARLTPLPRWAFFIRVNPKTVRARKQELTIEAIEELNARYDDLVSRGMLIAINNNGSPETAAAAIVDQIITDRDKQARIAIDRLFR